MTTTGHSVPLIAAGLTSTLVYTFGLLVNINDLVLHYSQNPLIPDILHIGLSDATASYTLPVSLAHWSRPVWGVVYGCQSSWLLFALANYCRRVPTGPAYNSPKLLPIPVHVFFSLTVLTQTGWLVMLDRDYLLFSLLLLLMCVGCSVISVCESYRALTATLPILQAQERTADIWAMRLLVQNSLAFFATWVTLHATLTLAMFLTFGMADHSVQPETGSLVQLTTAGFLLFVYLLLDWTVLDQYSRFVFLPYLGFVLFHSAQLSKDWPDIGSPVFIFIAVLTACSFVAVFVKVVIVVCRHVTHCQRHDMMTMPMMMMTKVVTRPLADAEGEKSYLLLNKK